MTLMQALSQFCDECNSNARLREMNRDWNRRILLNPDNVDSPHYLISENGEVSAGSGSVDNPDLVIEASDTILTSVFSGQMTPTEPYNAGDLLVRGHQDDIMRLDILTLLIWGN